MARKTQLRTFRGLLQLKARNIIDSAATIIETTTREHFVRGADANAGDLRDAGFPLSASGFSPSAAGLRADWDLLIQSGMVAAAYGKDVPFYQASRKRWLVHVGFDDSAPGSARGVSFGDPSSSYRSQTVDMGQLLSWLLDGTTRMVGRPVIANGFFMAYPKLVLMLTAKGLSMVLRTGAPKLYPVSKGRRGTPIVPT